MDLEQKAIERIRLASDLSLKHYNKPLVCEYSGGKDSDVLLELFRMSGIPFEVHNSHTTVDAPQTVRHIKNTFSELTDKGIKCEIDYHVQENGNRLTMESYSKKTNATYQNCSVLLFRTERRWES